MVSPLISGVFAYSQSGLPLRIKSFLPIWHMEGGEKAIKLRIRWNHQESFQDFLIVGGYSTTFNYAPTGMGSLSTT